MIKSDSGFCTIIAKNYIAFARTLCQSLKKQHPLIPFFVLVIDEVDNKFDPTKEDFEVLSIDKLSMPNIEAFTFKYDITELSTSVKPYFLEHLLNEFHLVRLVYLDPDIFVFQPLDYIFSLLENYSIILTPHITKSLPDDGLMPDDEFVLLAGIFNLGFIGISNTAISASLLSWWKNKLYDECIIDTAHARFVDQKWMDFAPCMFEKIYTLKEPGYNAAYWNLHERNLKHIEGVWYCNGKPLYFFHFSGIILKEIEILSKHQTRYSLFSRPNIRPLFEAYKDLLIFNQHLQACKWSYTYNYYSNGTKIHGKDRKYYYLLGLNRHEQFPNPFDVTGKDSFKSKIWQTMFLSKLKSKIKSLIPKPLLNALKSWIRSPYRSLAFKQQRQNLDGDIGINVWGYIKTESGVGEGVRRLISAINCVDIPNVLRNIIPPLLSSNDSTYQDFSHKSPYRVNLFHVNADQSDNTFRDKEVVNSSLNRYNIGYWAWELDTLPEFLHNAFSYYDEIWTYSSFCARAISDVSPIPVIVIPPPIRTYTNQNSIYQFTEFKDEPKPFIFLFSFDFLSYFERKNPLAVIEAFKCAFQDMSETVKLVIKCSNSQTDLENFEAMKSACAGFPIKLIDGYLSRQQMDDLIQNCDCYVSLHRSEGFGFGMLEAMTVGKPVIGTDYSGNTDFMNLSNSLPVKYNLITLSRDYGPYTSGNVWAEPDINHAAELMKYVVDNPVIAEAIGTKAKKDVNELFSTRVIGNCIKRRIELIDSKFAK
jgi:glycosyltransferase involved in cell wall biosynthesis